MRSTMPTSNKRWIQFGVGFLGLSTALFSPIAKAGDTVITFDINVASCASVGGSACNGFAPYNFIETWTLPSYNASPPTLYDFGGGNSLLKATIGVAPIVYPGPNPQVLSAAGMSFSDVGPSLYVENGTYLSNGIGSGYNIGDIQFSYQATLKPYNGDGTFEYKNYYQSMYVDFSGRNFANIVAITPSVLATYLAPGQTIRWGETGSWEHLGNCCNDEGRYLRSALSYSGYATIVSFQTSPIPEPETFVMMLAGLGLLGFASRRRSRSIGV